MVKWLELSAAICLLLLIVFIVIPTLMETRTTDPYETCLNNCISCSNDNYYVFKDECSTCIDLCKQKYNDTTH